MTGESETHRAVRAATLLWIGSVALSRILGLLRESVLAGYLGASGESDVYFAAFTIPDFMNYLLAGGALSVTFIPLFSGYIGEGREAEGWRLLSILTTFISLLLLVLVFAGELLAPVLAPLVAKGFTPAQLVLLTRLIRILLPAQLFLFVGFLLSAAQMAKGQHRFAVLAPLVYNLGTIVGGAILAPRIGAEGFCWGILAGAFVGSVLLQVVGARRVGMVWRPLLDLRHPGFRRYLILTAPMMVAQSIVVWDEWLVRWNASFLAAATISWLSYGRKVAQVPMAVFGQAAGAASFPVMARQVAEGRRAEVHATLLSAMRSILALALASQAVLLAAAPEVVALLFGSRKFRSVDIAETSALLLILAFGIGGWSVQALVSRGFFAFSDTLTPSIVGTATTLVSIPIYLLARREWGAAGLAAASVLAITANATVMHLLLSRKIRRLGAVPGEIGGFVVRLLVVCVLAGVAGYGVGRLLPPAELEAFSRFGVSGRLALLRAMVEAGTVGAVLLLLAGPFGLPELSAPAARVLSRIRRTA